MRQNLLGCITFIYISSACFAPQLGGGNDENLVIHEEVGISDREL